MRRYLRGDEAASATYQMKTSDPSHLCCCAQALSPEGRSKSFDSTADGYGRGEGFVAAILQRQDVHDHQRQINMITGSAVNQAGRSSGLTAPNGPAQTTLLKSAMHFAKETPGNLQCLSVHGTGTQLGDPIEVGALAQALPLSTSDAPASGDKILVSNKACYGHTEGTAGLTGLMLAGLVINQSSAPAVMHLRSFNPYVQAALSDWSKGQRGPVVPRQTSPKILKGLAGSSSFGMSGVNAHMLVSPCASSQLIEVRCA